MVVRPLVPVLFALLAASVVTSQPGAETPAPDTVFFNGKVVTVDARFNIEQAFAVTGDTFTAVGSNRQVRALAGKATRLVDLHGRTVIPGLGDNHDHVYNSAMILLRGVSLAGASNAPEALDRIRRAVALAPPNRTVFTTVPPFSAAERARISIRELDRISTIVPIVVFRGRLGSAVLNSAALKLAGITRETASFAGVPVPKDANGDPTGETLPSGFNIRSDQAALSILSKVLPPMTDAEEEEILIRAMHQSNALGLTSVRDLGLSPKAMRAYIRLWRKGLLTLRVSMGLEYLEVDDLEKALEVSGVESGFGDKWLRIDSLSELPTPEFSDHQQFTAAALTANRLGWRLAPHVVSPDSVNAALDAYEAADRVSSIHDKRWVLEHAYFPTSDQMQRMVKLGVVVSLQYAGFGEADPPDAARTTGPRLRELLDHHIIVSAGSDFISGQSSSDNPFIPIYFFVTRKFRNGDVAGPEQKISRDEALRVSTNNYAYTTFEDHVKGSIELGKLADFLILSDDILTVPEDKMLSVHPVATYVGGRPVYARERSGL
jgi:predicted amidohydrolase YtcJ